MTSGWSIESWDPVAAVGTVRSDQLGSLAFDASAAMVSDFVVGELVHVQLEPHETMYRVRKIWPDDPRFGAPTEPSASAPALDPGLAERSRRALESVPASLDYRVVGLGADLVLHGDDDAFAYGYRVEIRLRGVSYLEMPMGWDGKSWRLADARERAYLASRTELSEHDAAIRIVDEELRIYFVVCREIVPHVSAP